MKISRILVLLSIILHVVLNAQTCLNHDKHPVDWFLILKIPGSVSKGYLYYDSTMNEDLKYYQEKADSIDQPISNTFEHINQQSLNILAWNDKLPNGSTSSTKAHSKNIIAYSNQYEGIMMIHSMPGYPAIVENNINRVIEDSQNIYGQHFFCMTVGSYIKEIITKSLTINPNIYVNTKNQTFNSSQESRIFETSQFQVGDTSVKAIFKNGRSTNSSIFEDGMTVFLGSDIIAETWGRPYQEKWCGDFETPYTVGNSKGIYHSQAINWKSTQDHSKWAITTSQDVFYVCLGDMNRMTSQWKRGGGFTCIQNQVLHRAIKNKLVDPDICTILRSI